MQVEHFSAHLFQVWLDWLLTQYIHASYMSPVPERFCFGKNLVGKKAAESRVPVKFPRACTISSCKKRGLKKAVGSLLMRADTDSTRANGFTLTEGSFRWNIGKEFLIPVLRHWHGLPRAAVDAPFLEEFNDRFWTRLWVTGSSARFLSIGTRWSLTSLPIQTTLWF